MPLGLMAQLVRVLPLAMTAMMFGAQGLENGVAPLPCVCAAAIQRLS